MIFLIKHYLILLAGLPATTTPESTDFVTTAPAPIIADSPIESTLPEMINECCPTNAFESRFVNAPTSEPGPQKHIAPFCIMADYARRP